MQDYLKNNVRYCNKQGRCIAPSKLFRIILRPCKWDDVGIVPYDKRLNEIKRSAFKHSYAWFSSDILNDVQSDIFDKSKVLLKPMVLVVFYSPVNCRRQYHLPCKYHCGAIPLAAQANKSRRSNKKPRSPSLKVAQK